MLPRRALAWCCALALAHGSQSVTKLLPSSTAELRTALYGGECWLIGCIDMGDGISAKLMADTAKLLAPDECRVATLKCQAALPSGQTTLERLGITARSVKRKAERERRKEEQSQFLSKFPVCKV